MSDKRLTATGGADSVQELGDGSGRDFVAHWDWAASKGLLNRNTANAFKAAARRVLAIEGDDWESINVQSLNLDSLLDRFENLAKKDFTPDSLATYRSRFKKAHSLYLSYLADPRNYRPQAREREKTPLSTSGGPRRESKKTTAATADSAQMASTGSAIGARLIKYPFPIREGVIAELLLPLDLRKDEARRLAAFLDSLSVTPEPVRLLPEASKPAAPEA
jgi:hypothetical protein